MDASATILFGKTRRAVLSLMFGQPQRRFYLREMAALTGISPGALQHELAKLTGADLLVREQDGRRVTYRTNTEHPVFPELRALVQKTCGVPVLIEDALSPLEGEIDFAALYGSMVKGNDHARSDVDLLVVGNVDMARITEALSSVEEKIGRQIGLRLYAVDEYRKRLSRKDGFLTRVMSGPWTRILGDVPRA